jgi:hypothetical protein
MWRGWLDEEADDEWDLLLSLDVARRGEGPCNAGALGVPFGVVAGDVPGEEVGE